MPDDLQLHIPRPKDGWFYVSKTGVIDGIIQLDLTREDYLAGNSDPGGKDADPAPGAPQDSDQ